MLKQEMFNTSFEKRQRSRNNGSPMPDNVRKRLFLLQKNCKRTIIIINKK